MLVATTVASEDDADGEGEEEEKEEDDGVTCRMASSASRGVGRAAMRAKRRAAGAAGPAVAVGLTACGGTCWRAQRRRHAGGDSGREINS